MTYDYHIIPPGSERATSCYQPALQPACLLLSGPQLSPTLPSPPHATSSDVLGVGIRSVFASVYIRSKMATSIYGTCLTLNKTERQQKQKIINESLLQSSGMEHHRVWHISTCNLQESAASNHGRVNSEKTINP